VWEGKQATAKATADFSTAAASVPPSVEMTMFGCVGRKNREIMATVQGD
jgi:hypothetical protein